MDSIVGPIDSSAPPLVLVVDDDPSSRRVVSIALGRAGISVEVAVSGEDAIERLTRGDVDLLVADWRMPGLDGKELIAAVRALPDGGPYLIILTNLSGDDALVAALEAGADDYVPKSATRAELLARIRVGIRMRAVRHAAAAARRERDRSEDLADRLGRARADLEERNRDLEWQRGVLQAVLDTTPDGVRLVDHGGRVLVVNRAFQQGLGMFCDEGARTEVERAIALAPALSDPADFLSLVELAGTMLDLTAFDEYELLRSGRSFTRFTAPVYDTDGNPIGRLFVHHETTAERQAERLKDEFVAVASHELRTPLTSVRGYLDLVLEKEESVGLTERQIHLLGVAARNADRLAHLVADLILFAKVEAGQLSIAPAMCDAAQICSEARESVGPAAVAADVDVELSLPEAVPLEADAERLRQIIDNLLSNALKFTQPGGRVVLSAESVADRVRIAVQDNGMGIPADEQERLFDRFFRSRRATEEQIAGTGLGLAITARLAAAHGGSITCESSEGEGSRFTVELPVASAAAAVSYKDAADRDSRAA